MSVVIAETVLRRDRVVVVAGLAGVTIVAWAHMLSLASGMQTMVADASVAMPLMRAWGAVDLFLMVTMWTVMMVAMMVPTAAPMILQFAGLDRRRNQLQKSLERTSMFLLGYLVVWSGFAVLATVAQWGLQGAALLSPMMASTSPLLGGALLVAAGIFQWSPLKSTCLSQCRTPLGFLLTEWRDGAGGALLMGLRHGSYCVGCCWVLMGLLFILGVMNLLWVAILSAFVLVEKIVPGGLVMSRVSGLLLIGWGAWMVVS